MSGPEIAEPGKHVNLPRARPYGIDDALKIVEDAIAIGGADGIHVLQQLVQAGYTIVPVEPPPALLRSMAMRADHGLFMPAVEGDIFNTRTPIERDRAIEVALTEMRQVHEEVVGTGFYSDRSCDRYSATALGINPEPVDMDEYRRTIAKNTGLGPVDGAQ